MSVTLIARTVKELVSKNEFSQVKDIIIHLKDDFTLSSNPNSRKGGLVGLAAIAIALGRVSSLVRAYSRGRWCVLCAKCCTNRENVSTNDAIPSRYDGSVCGISIASCLLGASYCVLKLNYLIVYK